LGQQVAFASTVALIAGGLTGVGSASVSQTAAPAGSGGAAKAAAGSNVSSSYINYVAPDVQAEGGTELVSEATVAQAVAYDQKFASGNPVAAARLAEMERVALETGVSPADQLRPPTEDAQFAKLLTILVEFNPEAEDDFSGIWVPESVFGDRTCTELPDGSTQSGPLHNNIPDPATYEQLDNNSFWVPDFSPDHYNALLYTKKGLTERVRMDLTGPDGEPGIDISGYTMRKMYKHMSKSSYVVRGEATPWVEVEHSEAWYGADTCTQDENGDWVAGAIQDMNGHPDNPLGAGQLAIDAVAELAASQPDFPFADYDREDAGDVDGDGNLLEPDGIIDHVVLVHAGQGKSRGGGEQGTFAIWAHSSAVAGGAEIPGTGLIVSNYIVQPEDAGVGVFAHEYGHDLGLPDLYDTSGNGDSDIDFWDLMSSGSHSGPIFQSMPAHMGLWDKWILGWVEPKTFAPGDAAEAVDIGQNTYKPEGTEDGIKVDLPGKTISLAEPHSGENMWWSENDQSWAKNSITRDVDVPEGDDVRFWMWNNYVIELDWDFGVVEVSTDGGATWSQPVVYDEAGNEVTTPDDYADPNGNLGTFEKERGLTGTSDGWRHDYIDLTSYAGTTVQVRLEYETDAAFLERGWFADDFSVTADDVETWADDVESGENGWVALTDTWVQGEVLGAGWHIDTGTSTNTQYYMVEWRNFRGFDQGLKYAYDTSYSNNGPWKVDRIRYNSRGMLVWYRDTTYGSTNHVTATTYDLPSAGSKGGLLLVDSHFDPLRRHGEAKAADPSVLNNMPSRPQSSNAAFGLHPTFKFEECLAEVEGEDPFTEFCSAIPRKDAVPTFTDDQTWYPGIEVRGPEGEELFYFRDIDASVVIPNGNNEPYSTRVVNKQGELLPEWYGVDLGIGSLLGTGEPTQPYGVEFDLQSVGVNSTYATVMVQPAE